MRRRRERGALLGVVMILTVVLLAASLFAFWGLRSETSAAGADRLSRQLFDCAEQGLAVAKQFFSTPAEKARWAQYYATNVCASTSSPFYGTPACDGSAFQTANNGAAPVSTYPAGAPFTATLNVPVGSTSGTATIPLTYTFGIYNAPGESPTGAENDNNAIVYARCTDGSRSRAVQALINVPNPLDTDYKFTNGNGMRGQNNFNASN